MSAGGVVGAGLPGGAGGPGALAAGSRVAGYLLEEEVGAGGMAVVFRARDERLDRAVALKLLTPGLAADEEFRRRFLRESRAAAAVDDPHIIPVYEAGEAGGVLFLAMRYVSGGDVRGLLRREGALDAGRVAAIISPVASALDAAHGAGLVHRDVKPGNMLIDARPGRPDHVYVSDFGLAKAGSASVLTGTGVYLGTAAYMAPEQIQGPGVDGRADQYALGCAAFELLCGGVPFKRDQDVAVLWAHLSAPPPSAAARRPDLPPGVDEVLGRALAKAPGDRYASCREFAEALRQALGLPGYDRDPGVIRARTAASGQALGASVGEESGATVIRPVTGGDRGVQCLGCGRENPGGARFCSQCGGQLGIPCAACGAVPPPGARFCPDCGRTLAAAPNPANYTPRHIAEQILAVRGAAEGERKQVTVLFCDIVKSSDMAVRLGPEEFHLVVNRFFQGALTEVHRYEGTINQFLGDGFMALFGAPIAHEDHARRAVLAALGIVAQSEVKIRIGINSGLVVVGAIGDDLRMDYTAFGDTTVLAARLQAAAEPGAVLVSQRTAGLVRSYFQLEQVPPVQVKERTVSPLRVMGPAARTAPITAGDKLSPFIGRDSELAQLDRALDVAVGGEGQVFGLVGDPGLGKSRLALEFRRLAEDRAGFLEGRCLSYGAGVAYLPLFEVVRQACGIGAGEGPDVAGSKIELKIKSLELDMSLAQYLRHAFGLPASGPGLAGLDPQVIRARTFGALRALLVAEAARRPLLVLVEDLHWIDQTSQDFLAEFTDDLPSVPVLLLVTYRPGYSPPWLGKSFASQLALRPLSQAAGERIVASILGGDLAAAAGIAARGEGNPFFVEELARAARDQAGGVAEGSVPGTVQQVLAARIDRLGPDQKAALQLAAVLGREFSLDLAGQVWDGQSPLEARLEELKGLEFLRERYGAAERTFVFKHALTREVAYDGMLQARRRDLHGRAGAAVEHSGAGQFERSELLAYHYSRSTQPGRAIPHLATAGDNAKDRYANEEAIALYRQAITLTEELGGGRRADPYCDVCEHLGDVLARLSRYDQAIQAYEKALAVARDPLQRAHLHVLCSDAENGAHRYREALAQCDLAEQALGPAPDPPGPEWLSSWFEVQDYRMQILYWLNDTEEYARLIEQVRPFVEAHGSARQRAYFLIDLVQLALRRDRYLVTDQTLELALAADAAARAADPASYAGFTLGFTLLWHGDLDEATAVLEESLQEAERQGSATLRSRALTYLMAAGRKRRDVDGVRQAVGPVIEQAREAQLPEYEAMAVANRAWVAWRCGDEQAAAADAQAALDMWQRLPVRYFYDWMALWPLVAMALASGRPGQAVDHARGMLPPPQQLLQEPVRTLVEGSVRAWDASRPAEAEEMLHAAVRAAGDLGYL